MYNENIKSVVDYAFQDDAVKMRDALYNEINDKIFDAIEQRKQQLAQNLVNQYDTQEQEEE
jgi:elongation factor P hydroxylase